MSGPSISTVRSFVLETSLWKLSAGFEPSSWKLAGWPVSFQETHWSLETQHWSWLQFLGNWLASSDGAVSNSQLLTVPHTAAVALPPCPPITAMLH